MRLPASMTVQRLSREGKQRKARHASYRHRRCDPAGRHADPMTTRKDSVS
jgi:hypothetical protein